MLCFSASNILVPIFFCILNRPILFTLSHMVCDVSTFSGVFRILKLRVPSVNRIFPLRVLTAGAISLFLNITGAIAPVAPVLNTPLYNNTPSRVKKFQK